MLPNLVVAMRSLTVLGSISLFERVWVHSTDTARNLQYRGTANSPGVSAKDPNELTMYEGLPVPTLLSTSIICCSFRYTVYCCKRGG